MIDVYKRQVCVCVGARARIYMCVYEPNKTNEYLLMKGRGIKISYSFKWKWSKKKVLQKSEKQIVISYCLPENEWNLCHQFLLSNDIRWDYVCVEWRCAFIAATNSDHIFTSTDCVDVSACYVHLQQYSHESHETYWNSVHE